MVLNGFLFAVLGLTLTLATILGAAPGVTAEDVAIIFPPWTPAAQAVESATAGGATLVRAGRPSFVVVVHASKNGLPRAASSIGALFMLDATALRGCRSIGGARA